MKVPGRNTSVSAAILDDSVSPSNPLTMREIHLRDHGRTVPLSPFCDIACQLGDSPVYCVVPLGGEVKAQLYPGICTTQIVLQPTMPSLQA
jgi:hypothetical protein